MHRMASGSSWRSAGGTAYDHCGGAVLCSTVPKDARAAPEHGLARRGSLRVVADARLIRRSIPASDLESVEGREPTDAELILAAYRRWGESCADHLLGEFAFALWDGDRRTLLCTRDPVGSRPLCYTSEPRDGTLRVASSALQILAPGDLSGALDGVALIDLLSAYFHDPGRTCFAAVRNLPPGCSLRVSDRGVEVARYWHPERSGFASAAQRDSARVDWIATFRELVLAVVEDHVADAGAGAALMTSGGLDSSSIAAVAAQLRRCGILATQPRAFVEVFDRLRTCDEWHYASSLVEVPGLEVQRVVADDASDLVPDPSWDEPAETPVAFSGELVARALDRAREVGCGIVTTGFGGDTLFDAARWQSYDHVRRGRWIRALPWVAGARAHGVSWPRAAASVFLPPLLTTAGRARLDRLRGTDRYWQPPPWLQEEPARTARRRRSARILPRRFRGFARQRQYEHVVGLAQQGPAIELWGVHGARRGIEARFPLLDRRLAELVLAAPLDLAARPGPGGSKWLLRQAMVGILPEPIRCRQDKGTWAALTRDTICRRLSTEIGRLFTGSRLGEMGLVDDRTLRQSMARYCGDVASAPKSHGLLLGFAFLLERWLRSPGIDGRPVDFPSEDVAFNEGCYDS